MSDRAHEQAAVGLAFRVRGLAQAYPIKLGLARREVLHGVDLELARGRSLGLVGPNGSGKSTLLRVLAGVEAPRGGTLEVLGGSPQVARVRRRIGFVPDDSPYPREWSASSALEMVASVQGIERRERKRRRDAWLERVGLAEHARVRLARFSRGMKRRFDLAAALIHEPDLVLLDEPTAGLDALGYAVLDELLAQAKRRGASLVIASHVLADVHAHCEDLAVLIDGRVAFHGSPESLWTPGTPLAWELEGLDRKAASELEAWVIARGGRVVARQASSASLSALYRDFGADRAR